MSPDPYINHLLDTPYPCSDKSPVLGVLNTILHARAEARGLDLCPYPSRAVLLHEIHELIITREQAGPGKRVDKIAYLGYFEVTQGGVLWVGDHVFINGQKAAVLGGYDLTHFPNHMNIVLSVDYELKTGFEQGLHPGAEVRFEIPPERRK